ncbi:rRNA maturation RNase YbeY [Kineobactrum sediminis]|uniref:Endoribonuclease YbeY n=1 Tax=Kineobactrum sediminis TaxID=1905677 RepID=A0A2N5Y5Z8_9GAMM|nr:rRNA maturation RNase YbeY [Kineobactrum sediminis]PLW83813.1 rRNA maturation RNase YbeY [Kineobactrum sediminis]
MNAHVDIQNASSEPVPEEPDLCRWINAALAHSQVSDTAELCLRLVDEEEMTALNSGYRGKAGATNVLSFPADLPPELDLPLLGDIVICAPVVAREAIAQGKPPAAHWAHMVVHGCLHLLGYDHIDEDDAAVMEVLETTILAQLGLPCPYTDYNHHPDKEPVAQ